MIGGADMSFPRINMIAFWLRPASLLGVVGSHGMKRAKRANYCYYSCKPLCPSTWHPIALTVLSSVQPVGHQICQSSVTHQTMSVQ
jgi:heme/copper-type cytochrome/quinol oxidase subunit 1